MLFNSIKVIMKNPGGGRATSRLEQETLITKMITCIQGGGDAAVVRSEAIPPPLSRVNWESGVRSGPCPVIGSRQDTERSPVQLAVSHTAQRTNIRNYCLKQILIAKPSTHDPSQPRV